MNAKHNRTDILRTGIKLIREQGYGNTGIQDILKACGIPKGSFYNFFSSKEAFVIEAVNVYNDYMIDLFESIDSNENLSAKNKIMAFFKMSNEVFISEECSQNCMLLSLATEVTDEKNVFSKLIKDSFKSYKKYLLKWLTAAQEDASIRQDFSALELANILYDSYHGAVMRMKYTQNPNSLHNFLERTIKIID